MHSNDIDNPTFAADSEERLLQRLEDLLSHGVCDSAAEARQLLADLQHYRQARDAKLLAQQNVEAALARSLDHYARLFDMAPIGYLVLDRRGRVRQSNVTVERLLQCGRERLANRRFAGFLIPADRRAMLLHLREVLNPRVSAPQARPRPPETVVVRLSGDAGRRVLRLVSTMQDGTDGPECLTAVMDVSASFEAEQARWRNDRMRQAVMDALPANIAVLSDDGGIISVNRGWQRFAERNEGAPALAHGTGLNYLDACRKAAAEGDDEAETVAEGIAAVLDGRLPRFVYQYPCHPPGSEAWFELTSVPVKGDGAGAIVMHFDITQRKLADDRMRRAREATSSAARANAVGILATSLLHEISQPLSAAGFYAGTAAAMIDQGKTDAARLSTLLGSLDTQIRRAAEILQRLRDFLRARELRVRPVAVDEVVRDALGLTRSFAADRAVRTRYARPAPGVHVAADRLQVEQVLVNLIRNAIEAFDGLQTQRRDVLVEVAPDERFVEFAVMDTGPGIAADAMDLVFNIFTSTKDSGLGMGLAISRDIIEAHGGKLWADPGSPEGAVLRFTLPRAL